jgi:hypothetical protein
MCCRLGFDAGVDRSFVGVFLSSRGPFRDSLMSQHDATEMEVKTLFLYGIGAHPAGQKVKSKTKLLGHASL